MNINKLGMYYFHFTVEKIYYICYNYSRKLMNLINNILIHTGDSKEIALAAHNPSVELDPTVAYIVTMTSLKPLLEKGYTSQISSRSLRSRDDVKIASSMSPTFEAKPEPVSKTLERNIRNIKDKFEDIKKIIDELKAKGDFFMKLISKDSNNPHYIVGEEWQEFENKFVFATKRIMETIKLIRESVKKLRSILSKGTKYPALDQIEKYCNNLIDKIPEPSSKWEPGSAKYEGFKWMHESINGEIKTVFCEWKKWFEGIKNPVGLLEILLDKDTSKKDDYLKTIGNGLDSVEELFVNVGKYSRMLRREEVFKHLKGLGTEEAYMYLITTVLPMLQDESSSSLEEQGNTMQLISGIYERWNSIQKLINESIKQSNQGAAAADELGNKIKGIVQDIEYQLKRARMYLPSSAHTLLDTMKSLSNKLVTEYPKDFFKVAKDSDQTAFKTYMDNLGQGVTALTSISNMSQQQLQIDTQYYNSLLGFQKSSQDSVNKIIQSALNNMRSA